MPDFIGIHNTQEIQLSSNWTKAYKFESKDRVVTENGQSVGSDYSGRTFKIVEKYVRDIPFFERIGRIFLGIVQLLFSFGSAPAVKSALRLITKNHEAVRYAVPTLLTEKEEIENRCGHTATCIKRTPNASGGYIYTLKVNDAYDALNAPEQLSARGKAFQEKQKEIYPAVEITSASALIFDPTLTDENCLQPHIDLVLQSTPPEERPQSESDRKKFIEYWKKSFPFIQYRNIFIKLGFEAKHTSEGTFINIPDREALLANWEELRKLHPDLPKLDIISSEGIADDLSFMEAYFTHDVLLSTGKEFLHDTFFHILAILTLMLSSGKEGNPTYTEERSRLRNLIKPEYQRIVKAKELIDNPNSPIPDATRSSLKRDIDKVGASLSAYIDALSTQPTYEHLKNFSSCNAIIEKMMKYADDPNYRGYWEKRFGKDQMNGEIVKNLWSQINDITTVTVP